MLENHPRNPLLIFIFTFVGALLRYIFFSFLRVLQGKEPVTFYTFSNGFKQIVFNLLLTLALIFGAFILFAYYSIKASEL